MTMTAEWISIGLAALVLLLFVLDVASNRRRVPRPRKFELRQPDAQVAPAPKPLPERTPQPELVPQAPVPEPVLKPVIVPVPDVVPAPDVEPQISVFERVRRGLGKTRASLTGGLADMFSAGKKIDEVKLVDHPFDQDGGSQNFDLIFKVAPSIRINKYIWQVGQVARLQVKHDFS